jgi:hypothetical protein
VGDGVLVYVGVDDGGVIVNVPVGVEVGVCVMVADGITPGVRVGGGGYVGVSPSIVPVTSVTSLEGGSPVSEVEEGVEPSSFSCVTISVRVAATAVSTAPGATTVPSSGATIVERA